MRPDNYTVQPGDTMNSIGRRFGVNYQDLAKMNNIQNPNMIRAGTTLSLGGSPITAGYQSMQSPGGVQQPQHQNPLMNQNYSQGMQQIQQNIMPLGLQNNGINPNQGGLAQAYNQGTSNLNPFI